MVLSLDTVVIPVLFCFKILSLARWNSSRIPARCPLSLPLCFGTILAAGQVGSLYFFEHAVYFIIPGQFLTWSHLLIMPHYSESKSYSQNTVWGLISPSPCIMCTCSSDLGVPIKVIGVASSCWSSAFSIVWKGPFNLALPFTLFYQMAKSLGAGTVSCIPHIFAFQPLPTMRSIVCSAPYGAVCSVPGTQQMKINIKTWYMRIFNLIMEK